MVRQEGKFVSDFSFGEWLKAEHINARNINFFLFIGLVANFHTFLFCLVSLEIYLNFLNGLTHRLRFFSSRLRSFSGLRSFFCLRSFCRLWASMMLTASIMEGKDWASFSEVNKSCAAFRFGQSWTFEEQLAADTMTDNHVARGGFSTVWTFSFWFVCTPFGELCRCCWQRLKVSSKVNL